MTITIVVAVARNGVIGAAGGMPWHLPADLRRFRALTTGHPMIMGRTTFTSIGRPLPGRTTVVLTRDPGFAPPGVRVAHSWDAAVECAVAAPGGEQVMVVGGAQIYALALPVADRVELTAVDAEVAGDTFFPALDPGSWRCTAVRAQPGFAFRSYRRAPDRAVELGALLAGLRAARQPGEYAYAALDGAPADLHPVVRVVEPEGVSVVLPVPEADAAGLSRSGELVWITLRVDSDLYAVGLTAAVSTTLAKAGIAANVVAGLHHDHLFVPAADADRALDCLARLGRG